MSNQGYWEREDGHPWESVDSLPPPLSEVSSPTPDPYPWESLESLPTPFDAEPKTSAPKKDLSPKAKEWWSFQNHKEEVADEEEQQEEEWIDTPKLPITSREPARPAVEDHVKAVGDIKCIPFSRSAPVRAPARDPYPPYPKPPPWSYPGPLYPGPLRDATRQGPGHRRNDHPPVISLPRPVEQLGISEPVHDPRRSRRGRQRPLSPLSPPPTKPTRSDFHIADISYEAHEERLYADGREINFPKVPTYLPPAVKKTRSPLRERWDYVERHTHTHTHRRLPWSYGHPAAPATDPFWEEQDRLWPRDNYQNLIPNHPNNPRPMPPARNIGTLMKEWEDRGLVKISKRRKTERKKEQRRVDRYAYHVSHGDEGSRGRKATVEDEEGDVEVESEEHQKGDDDAPEWTDEEDRPHRQRRRECLRRDSIDGHEIDDHNSIHYPPPSPQAFNFHRIPYKALKTLGDPSKRNSKGKGKAPASAMEGEDAEGIYDASSPSAFTELKKPNPYASFKKTTSRHPRHFHKSKKHPDEVFERLVLDRRTLAEGEEEPTGKNKRKPMIDMVNLKTGEKTRREIRGYERLPRMIRVAAGVGVEGLGGLPPRRRRDVEEVDVGGDEGEEAQKRRRKSRKAKPKKMRDGCIVM